MTTAPKSDRTILVCSCEQSMPLNLDALTKAAKGARLVSAKHLCGPELDLFRKAASSGRVTVACTAQRALFEDVADADTLGASLTFVNIRETAGWSTEATKAAQHAWTMRTLNEAFDVFDKRSPRYNIDTRCLIIHIPLVHDRHWYLTAII